MYGSEFLCIHPIMALWFSFVVHATGAAAVLKYKSLSRETFDNKLNFCLLSDNTCRYVVVYNMIAEQLCLTVLDVIYNINQCNLSEMARRFWQFCQIINQITPD